MGIIATIIAAVMVTAGIFGTIAIMSIIRGWVFSILWGWFIVPSFGLPELSIPLAIGMALVVGFLTHQHQDSIKKQYCDGANKILVMVLSPFASLLVGWIVTRFI